MIALISICGVLGACTSNATMHHSKSGRLREHEAPASPTGAIHVTAVEPLAIGTSITIESAVMSETRRLNVLVPTVYGKVPDGPLPVLYMLDGGMNEDFLHVAGLLQILVSNGTMRPFILVGIENTQRRRDLTGPTTSAEDRNIAPQVGGSAVFRRFLKEEVLPVIQARYRTTAEAAIVGESLAGLFVVETYFLEPDLFTIYVAIDPSLGWSHEALVKAADGRLGTVRTDRKCVFLACSSEPTIAEPTARLAALFDAHKSNGTAFRFASFPTETHSTVYHPAALIAFRAVFAPSATAEENPVGNPSLR